MQTLKTADWFPDPSFPFHINEHGVSGQFGRHSHEFFEFFLMTGGRLQHTLNRKTQILGRGDIVLLSPARHHSFRAVAGEPAQSLQAIFLPSFLGVGPAYRLDDHGFTDLVFMLPFFAEGCMVFHLSGKTYHKVRMLMEEMLAEFAGLPRGFETAIRAKLTDLLITVARAYDRTTENRAPQQPDLSGTAAAVLASLGYIEEHCTENLQLEDVARTTAGISREYFSKVFHTITGTTFSGYLTDLRITRARHMLQTTGLKIISVCHECGFNDLSHFNSTFKKITGVTPSAYRKEKSSLRPR